MADNVTNPVTSTDSCSVREASTSSQLWCWTRKSHKCRKRLKIKTDWLSWLHVKEEAKGSFVEILSSSSKLVEGHRLDSFWRAFEQDTKLFIHRSSHQHLLFLMVLVAVSEGINRTSNHNLQRNKWRPAGQNPLNTLNFSISRERLFINERHVDMWQKEKHRCK